MIFTINDIKNMVTTSLSTILEGVDYSYDGKNINFSINQDKTDKGNLSGNMSVDTRVFGRRQDILNGDGTTKARGLQVKSDVAKETLEFYQNVMAFLNSNDINGLQNFLNKSNSRSVTTVEDWIKELTRNKKSLEDIKSLCTRHIEKCEDEINIYGSTNDRVVNSSEPEEKTSRYISGMVPNTDVRFVSLFSMKDFNFSDAIKHIQLRPNGNTDKVMGVSKTQRPKDKIPVTYDDNVHTTVAQNFSLDRVQPYHFKQQYQLKGRKYDTSVNTQDDLQRELSKTKDYTSVNQFMDKSIIYANYVLKVENFRPDFIVAAPSSSKYNEYYCRNLSMKLGVPYIHNFFMRNVLNVKCDDGYIEKMKADGLTDKDIKDLEDGIRSAVIREVMSKVYEPIKAFIKNNSDVFKSIKSKKNKQPVPFEVVQDFILKHSFEMLKSSYETDGKSKLQKELVALFLTSRYTYHEIFGSSKPILNTFMTILRDKNRLKSFKQALAQSVNVLNTFCGLLKTRGYRLGELSYTSGEPFKITGFSKRHRPYVKHFYVVHNDHLVNGELPSRYKGAKFLIFDEDMNSGATLKLSIEALKDKLPQLPSTDILCLVNGYSAGGM